VSPCTRQLSFVEPIADLFGITNEKRKRRMTRFVFLAIFVFVAVVGAAYYLFETWDSVANKPAEATERLALFSLAAGLLLNLGIFVWSIGILLSQKDQGDNLNRVLLGRQRFDEHVVSQITFLREHFVSEINGHHAKLDLDVYVSSPGFGILGGASGLQKFVDVVEYFIEKAVDRAKTGEHSRLNFYFWDQDKHKGALGRSKQKWLWENDAKRGEVLKQMKRLVESVAKLKDLSHRNGIYVKVFSAGQDELRFVILREDTNICRAAMMAMGPIVPDGCDTEDNLHSVMVLEETPGGVKKIDDFFTSFLKTHNLTGSAQEASAATKAQDLVADPIKFFKDYFELTDDDVKSLA
jgi:hypothetical protein